MGHLSDYRQTLAILVIALAVCAWIIVGGVILVDAIITTPMPAPTPTVAIIAARPTVTIIPTVTPTSASSPTDAPTSDVLPTTNPTPTLIPVTDFAATAAPTQSSVLGPQSSPSGCTHPDGWVPYTVEEGDTLFGFQLGSDGTIDVATIMQANCLNSKMLAIGQVIYLPPGVAEKSPKVDDSAVSNSGSPAMPSGPTRSANCPCSIAVHQGWRLEQIAAAVDRTPVGFSGNDFLATVAPNAPTPPLAFLSSRPAGKSLEGFMYPGMYTLDNTTSAVQFRDMILNAFAANVSPQAIADSASRGYTFWQIIVLASIVQRESVNPDYQKLIASTFYNRLAQNKGIAATPTLQYALGRAGNWWPRIVGKTINTDTPYNTNIYIGLPPSPISNPGVSAILGTVYAPHTDYQFFNDACGGGMYFTATYEDFVKGLKCN